MNDRLWNSFVEGATKIISDAGKTFLIKEGYSKYTNILRLTCAPVSTKILLYLEDDFEATMSIFDL